MKIIKACPGQRLSLGHKGENLALRIVFDIAPWISTYGPGTAHLLHQRVGDAEPYPVATVQEGAAVSWDVTAADTDSVGHGKYELRYYVGEALVKSVTGEARTQSALIYGADPPEAHKGWVDQVLEAATSVLVAAKEAAAAFTSALAAQKAAQQSQQDADAAAQEAQRSKTNAENAAARAEQGADNARRSQQDAETAAKATEADRERAEAAAKGAEDHAGAAELSRQNAETAAGVAAGQAAAAQRAAEDSAAAAGSAESEATAAENAAASAEAAKGEAQQHAESAGESAQAAAGSEQRSAEILADMESMEFPRPAEADKGKAVIVNEDGNGYTLGDPSKQADWTQNDPAQPDYVKGRTHWVETAVEEVNITFDGDMTGKEAAPLDDVFYLVKVSEAAPTLETLRAGTMKLRVLDETTGEIRELIYDIAEMEVAGEVTVEQYNEQVAFVFLGGVLIIAVASEAGGLGGISFSRGTNFLCSPGYLYVSGLTCATETTKIHHLDPKYIDAEWMAKEEVAVVEILPETAMPGSAGFSTINGRIALVAGETYAVTLNGTTYEMVCKEAGEAGDTLVYLGNAAFVGLENSGESFFVGVPPDGDDITAIVDIDGVGGTISVSKTAVVAHPIPEKYLPEIPYFDLPAMGLPNLPVDLTQVSASADCAEIMTALAKGPVKIRWVVDMGGTLFEFDGVVNGLHIPIYGVYNVSVLSCVEISEDVPIPIMADFNFFSDNTIAGRLVVLTTGSLG